MDLMEVEISLQDAKDAASDSWKAWEYGSRSRSFRANTPAPQATVCRQWEMKHFQNLPESQNSMRKLDRNKTNNRSSPCPTSNVAVLVFLMGILRLRITHQNLISPKTIYLHALVIFKSAIICTCTILHPINSAATIVERIQTLKSKEGSSIGNK